MQVSQLSASPLMRNEAWPPGRNASTDSKRDVRNYWQTRIQRNASIPKSKYTTETEQLAVARADSIDSVTLDNYVVTVNL